MFLPMLGAPCTYALLPGGSDVSGRGNGSQLERKKWNDDHVPHDAPDRDSKADCLAGQDRYRTPADLRRSR